MNEIEIVEYDPEWPQRFELEAAQVDYGQTAPYPSLAVRARNGRVADHTPGTLQGSMFSDQ